MKTVIGRPPEWIWERAHKMFKIDDDLTTYAYGDTIFNPAGLRLPIELVAHEEVHGLQQRNTEGGAEGWWIRYFNDPVFRAAQEAEAYGRQYAVLCMRVKDRNQRAIYLHQLAELLSSGMYGVNVSTSDAKKAIMRGAGL